MSQSTARGPRAPAEAEGRRVGHLRVIDGQRTTDPRIPAERPSATIDISDAGRALLSSMAERAERELMAESGEETIARFVADGIEEGWLD